MAIELGIAARLVVGAGTGVEDAVPNVRSVRIGETELPGPKLEPTPVAIPPDGEEGVTVSTINLDVRKQTSHCVSIVSILKFWSRVDLPLCS